MLKIQKKGFLGGPRVPRRGVQTNKFKYIWKLSFPTLNQFLNQIDFQMINRKTFAGFFIYLKNYWIILLEKFHLFFKPLCTFGRKWLLSAWNLSFLANFLKILGLSFIFPKILDFIVLNKIFANILADILAGKSKILLGFLSQNKKQTLVLLAQETS